MADCIHLRDILCYGYSGLLPEERVLGQRFIVHADLEVDLKQPGQSDHIEDTVDYRSAIEGIRAIVTGEPFKLIEALAEAVAVRLKQDARVMRVRVEVIKPAPPIPDFLGSVSVEIWR